MRHIIPISGKDSFATAILQMDNMPHLKYELIFNPVGFELPETLEWLTKVEAYLGLPLLRIGVDLKTTDEWVNGFRPSINSRWCTRIGKLEPTEQYFEGEGMIYYGLRYDEPERIGYINKGKSELIPVYTLRNFKYALDDVLDLVASTPCPPPSFRWEHLAQMFIDILGEDFIYSNLTPYQVLQLFAWRIRQNCYNCFFMRRYEWVGLLFHHPTLFWNMVAFEEVKEDRDKVFTTIQGLPLRELANKKDEILARHVRTTANALIRLVKDKELKKQDVITDFMSFTSCGLMCGK